MKLKFVDNKQRKKKVSKINENCSIRRFVFALVGFQLKTKSWIWILLAQWLRTEPCCVRCDSFSYVLVYFSLTFYFFLNIHSSWKSTAYRLEWVSDVSKRVADSLCCIYSTYSNVAINVLAFPLIYFMYTCRLFRRLPLDDFSFTYSMCGFFLFFFSCSQVCAKFDLKFQKNVGFIAVESNYSYNIDHFNCNT